MRMNLRSVLDVVGTWKQASYPMLYIGEEEEVCSLLEGEEESLHTSEGNAATQNSGEIRKVVSHQ
jgi:hypothetical protein